MRSRLEEGMKNTFPSYIKKSDRLIQLEIFDRYLDGKQYDHLSREFDEDQVPGYSVPTYVPMRDRKPSIQYGLPKMVARAVARKLFAGRHAPSFVLEDDPEMVKEIVDLLKEASAESEMLETVTLGSVGSACMAFKFVKTPDSEEPQLALNTYRAKICFPEFDQLKELKKLRIAYLVTGAWFIDLGYAIDAHDEAVDAQKNYWFIEDLTRSEEIHYFPIKESQWNPVDGLPEPGAIFPERNKEKKAELVRITEGDLKLVKHDLGIVPAQWFRNLFGGEFPNGDSLFEPALDNLIIYDYGMSQLDLGIKNCAIPMVQIIGSPISPVGQDGQPIPRSPSRYIQFEPEFKGMDGGSTGKQGAELIEPTGEGMAVGITYYEKIKKDMTQEIASSRKDPDKVTTAMSGKGMEMVEEEFSDLTMELRLNYGSNGYLKLVKKILRAAIKLKLSRFEGLTEKAIAKLELAWPDLHQMGPQEYMQFTQGLAQAQESGLLTQRQAADTHRGKVDVPGSVTGEKLPKPLPKGTLTGQGGSPTKEKKANGSK